MTRRAKCSVHIIAGTLRFALRVMCHRVTDAIKGVAWARRPPWISCGLEARAPRTESFTEVAESFTEVAESFTEVAESMPMQEWDDTAFVSQPSR